MDLAVAPFLNELIRKFSSHKFIWSQFIDMISELDVLISLSQVSGEMEIRCVPEFIEFGLAYEEGLHVGLSQLSKNVVRNSLSFEG